MPKGYEKMRDEFIKQGMSRKAAEGKAARIWNSQDHAVKVGRTEHRATRTRKTGRHR